MKTKCNQTVDEHAEKIVEIKYYFKKSVSEEYLSVRITQQHRTMDMPAQSTTGTLHFMNTRRVRLMVSVSEC